MYGSVPLFIVTRYNFVKITTIFSGLYIWTTKSTKGIVVFSPRSLVGQALRISPLLLMDPSSYFYAIELKLIVVFAILIATHYVTFGCYPITPETGQQIYILQKQNKFSVNNNYIRLNSFRLLYFSRSVIG
jgi:hypothetical protein